jgi:DNA-binding PadR family transcriptional regulator
MKDRFFWGGSYHRDRGWKWGWQDLEDALGLGVSLGKHSRFFENGEVRLAILSLLDEGPKHGYQLMKEMQERSGGLYRASAGTVYPTLQLLEDEGLIESEKKDGRRVYSITDAGRAELGRDPETVRRIWDRAESWGDWGQRMGPNVIALSGSLAAVVKSTLAAAQWAGGDPKREEQVRKIIRRACEDLDELTEDKG